ncbi:hypothetical protein P3T23_004406 [Paraburkholderia sp. GAS448]|uniref:three component ABC system middle component n=1 Tax=Paraburkholderia sp. GAS448 TaxID=3035136 RepID=UPI003D19F635
MRSLIDNEVLGSIAIQEVLRYCPEQKITLPNSLLVLPLLFNKRIRATLKNKNTKIIGCKDFILSHPNDLLGVRTLYQDLIITSLNSQILAIELGIASLAGGYLELGSVIYSGIDAKEYGSIAADISLAAPNTSKILREDPVELYGNFRIPV